MAAKMFAAATRFDVTDRAALCGVYHEMGITLEGHKPAAVGN
jgi:hypothetical protein